MIWRHLARHRDLQAEGDSVRRHEFCQCPEGAYKCIPLQHLPTGTQPRPHVGCCPARRRARCHRPGPVRWSRRPEPLLGLAGWAATGRAGEGWQGGGPAQFWKLSFRCEAPPLSISPFLVISVGLPVECAPAGTWPGRNCVNETGRWLPPDSEASASPTPSLLRPTSVTEL